MFSYLIVGALKSTEGSVMRSKVSSHASFLSLGLALSIVPLLSRTETEGNYTYTVTDAKATITAFKMSYSGPLSITNNLNE